MDGDIEKERQTEIRGQKEGHTQIEIKIEATA